MMQRRTSIGRWLEANTSATLPLLVSCLALVLAAAAVLIAHKGSSGAVVQSATPLTVPNNLLQHNGWENASSRDSSVGYYKGANGRVYLSGALRPLYGRIPKNSTAFTLPPGYRPLHAITEPITVKAGERPEVGFVSIAPWGSVMVTLPTSEATSDTKFVSLDGVSFTPGA